MRYLLRHGFAVILASLLCWTAIGATESLSPASHPTAWLLIAVKNYDGRQVVAEFRQFFKNTDLNVQIRENATQEDLFDALTSSDSVVVTWIGHSRSLQAGLLSPAGVLRDADGNEVTSIFRAIHPNIRWLGMIACESDSLIEEYRKQGLYKANSLLQVIGFPEWIDPVTGWHQMKSVMHANWQMLSIQVCAPDSDRALPITLRQEVSALASGPSSPVRVELRGRVVAVFPALNPGDKEVQEAWLRSDDLRSSAKLEFEVISSAQRDSSSPELGQLSVRMNEQTTELQPLVGRDGKPLGKTRRVYLLPSPGLPDVHIVRRPGSC